MNNDNSYIGVPTTTQEVMANQDHDHPVESSETLTLAGPEAPAAPKLSRPTVVGLTLLSIAPNLTLAWS